MKLIDILLLIPIILGAFSGFRRGFLLEIASFLALFLGILGGLEFLHWGIGIINQQFNLAGSFVPILSFLLIFIAIIVLVNLLGKALKKVVHMTPLGSVDTVVGGAIGALKWAFILSLIIWVVGILNIPVPRHLTEDSEVYSFIASIAPAGIDMIAGIIPITSDLFDELADMLSKSES